MITIYLITVFIAFSVMQIIAFKQEKKGNRNSIFYDRYTAQISKSRLLIASMFWPVVLLCVVMESYVKFLKKLV